MRTESLANMDYHAKLVRLGPSNAKAVNAVIYQSWCLDLPASLTAKIQRCFLLYQRQGAHQPHILACTLESCVSNRARTAHTRFFAWTQLGWKAASIYTKSFRASTGARTHTKATLQYMRVLLAWHFKSLAGKTFSTDVMAWFSSVVHVLSQFLRFRFPILTYPPRFLAVSFALFAYMVPSLLQLELSTSRRLAWQSLLGS